MIQDHCTTYVTVPQSKRDYEATAGSIWNVDGHYVYVDDLLDGHMDGKQRRVGKANITFQM